MATNDESVPADDASPPSAAPASSPPSSPSVVPYATERTQILQYSSAAANPVDDWIHIFRARDYLEANLLVGKLQEQGLHARVDMENVASLGSWAGGGPGGSNVQALTSEAEQAKRIIDELEKVRAARYAPNRVPCPQCGHTPALRQFRPIRVAALAAIGLFIISGVLSGVGALPRSLDGRLSIGLLGLAIVLLIFPAMPRWLCPSCGHRWEQAEPEEVEDEDEQEDDEGDEDEEEEREEKKE